MGGHHPLLPKKGRGPVRRDDRQILSGVFYILPTGTPWRDLPEQYDPHTTVYNRYIRWARRGLWKGIFDALAEECEDSLVFIDASIVKLYRSVGGAEGGSWRKILAAHAEVAR